VLRQAAVGLQNSWLCHDITPSRQQGVCAAASPRLAVASLILRTILSLLNKVILTPVAQAPRRSAPQTWRAACWASCTREVSPSLE
jgi:hypothetical protein